MEVSGGMHLDLSVLQASHLNPNKARLIGRSWSESNLQDEYFKGCKWSPDGTCLLTSSNDAVMRLFDLPLELYNNLCLSLEYQCPSLRPSVTSKIGGLVYDYGWYPAMTSTDPETCCFFTTSFCEPVHLWDAYSGTIRCSYRGYNNQDELHAALSVTFDLCGDLLLCGYKNHIKIFHTNVPGRNFTTISTKDVCEQRGIVSCIAVNPSMPNLFAAGTYTKSVGLYSLDGHGICLLSGQGGGLTQLLFTHDGTRLLAAGRKDSEILCWDLRNLGKVLWVAQRPHTTNQRLYMDLSPENNHLLSGSTDGNVYAWDLHGTPISSSGVNSILPLLTKWQAHSDCVNGLSVHRHIPIIATASGQRHFKETDEEDIEDEYELLQKSIDQSENSIKIWWAGKNKDEMT